MKPVLVVSFSGGRTSAFMCAWLLKNFSDKYELVFVFANTGREHPETLAFVDRCDKYFGLNLVWLEAVVSPKKGVGIRHKVVTYKTASRNGEPFEAFIAKEGIPNIKRAHCTSRLKTRPIRHWMKSKGYIKRGFSVQTAVGMRADEPDRADMSKASVKEFNLVFPLAHWAEPGFDKQDVNDYWDSMPFNLYIPEHYGNCITCFKKSENKLALVAHEHGEWFAWNQRMEDKYGHVNADEGDRHRWWRGKKTTKTLCGLAMMKDYGTLILMTKSAPDSPGGCGDECRPFDENDLL